jgi:hypothetical protein
MKENNSTPLTDVQVTENGIQVQDTFYDYSKISSFAVIFDGNIARMLRLALKKGIAPMIDIPLTQDVNPAELKNFLLSYMTENPNAEFTKSDRMIQAMKL